MDGSRRPRLQEIICVHIELRVELLGQEIAGQISFFTLFSRTAPILLLLD
jgi:hypothetical protein